MRFSPRLEILPAAQRTLWPELAAVPHGFVLYGGTGLALRLGYLDVAALLRAGVPLEQILGAARALFGQAFNPLIAQKTLTYFEGGDLASLPQDVKRLLVERAAQDLPVQPVPKLSQRIDEG